MSSVKSVQQFYNDLSEKYHLIFADWRSEVLRQGPILDRLICSRLGPGKYSVLDCTCGIGIQAISLALLGHQVKATDVSSGSIERAKREAGSFGVNIIAEVADLRYLDSVITDQFKVVLSFDNSLSHFLDRDDLLLAARQVYGRLEPGGLFMASIRDYDQVGDEQAGQASQLPPTQYSEMWHSLPSATLPRVFDDGNRRIVFQIWDWADDRKSYCLNQFLVRSESGRWQTTNYSTRYRALLRQELEEVLIQCCFKDIKWQTPAESGF